MNGLPYYKRYPRDFIEGSAGMPLELKGAYSVLLDLIYIQSGKLPDDPQYIAGAIGCSVRKWNSLRADLIARGKIHAQDGVISNLRADKELIILSSHQDKQRENASGPRKNKDLQKPQPSHTEPEPEIEANASISRARKRASRLPEDWQLPREWGEWALREGWSEPTIRREAEKFRDYWIAAPGAKGRKLDWFATWRNWLRNVPKQEKADGRKDGAAAERARRAGERWAARAMDLGQGGDPSGALFHPRLIAGGGRTGD